MYYTINAANCTEYLRSIGVEVSDEQAAAWAEQKRETRRRRRAHTAELKCSCGHFRTYDTRIVSDAGTPIATYCSDCRKCIGSRNPLPTPAPSLPFRLMPSKAQIAVATAKVALTNALYALDEEVLRVPLCFTVEHSPLEGPLSVYVDAEGLRMVPLGLDLHADEAVHLSWAEIEHIGTEVGLHGRLVKESQAMDEDLRFLRRLYFRHGGVLRLRLKKSERRPRKPRVHDIGRKLASRPTPTPRNPGPHAA